MGADKTGGSGNDYTPVTVSGFISQRKGLLRNRATSGIRRGRIKHPLLFTRSGVARSSAHDNAIEQQENAQREKEVRPSGCVQCKGPDAPDYAHSDCHNYA